ncbi:MAG: DEAD/DEAH box helicase [Candidatus Fimadaptatus sp.]|jgi:ATP-dependent RNA helicase DeaD
MEITNIAMEEVLESMRDEVRRAIADMGFETPTPIQQMTIPEIVKGRDIVGQAQTGTGKTAAFGIPLINRIDIQNRRPQALVLCPTRELALQVARELTRMAKYMTGLRILPVYGGQPIEAQLRFLRQGAQVIVGTPGRVIDHITRGTLDLSTISYAVLDEADEMLDMGFRDDIQTILDNTPEDRQTLLFSATMPRPILMLAQRYQREPQYIRVQSSELTVDTIEQVYIEVMPGQKTVALSRVLDMYDPALTLVFVNTKLGAEEVVTYLQKQGYAASALHGDMRQVERDNIMARFRAGIVKVLVATDVAARGLDVKGIEAVINYDIPQDVDQYVHRIGRTGRAGKLGKAFTFVVGRELARMWDIRRVTKARILLEKAPLRSAVMEKRTERFTEQLMNAQHEESDVQRQTAMKLLEQFDAVDVVTQLLGLCVREVDGPEDLTPARPAPRPQSQRTQGQRPPYGAQRKGPYGRPVPQGQRAQGQRPYGRPAPARGEGRQGGRPFDKPRPSSARRPGDKPQHFGKRDQRPRDGR